MSAVMVLNDKINRLKERVDRLEQRSTARAEIAGAMQRVTSADLPAAGAKGRMFFLTDIDVFVVDIGTGYKQITWSDYP